MERPAAAYSGTLIASLLSFPALSKYSFLWNVLAVSASILVVLFDSNVTLFEPRAIARPLTRLLNGMLPSFGPPEMGVMQLMDLRYALCPPPFPSATPRCVGATHRRQGSNASERQRLPGSAVPTAPCRLTFGHSSLRSLEFADNHRLQRGQIGVEHHDHTGQLRVQGKEL